MVTASDVLTESPELKQRDAEIINKWLYDGMTQAELAAEYKMSPDNVYCIIRKNRSILKLDKDYEKAKRIHDLHNQLRKKGDSEKDRLDIIEALRKEYDSDSKISIVSQFFTIETPAGVDNRLTKFLNNEVQA